MITAEMCGIDFDFKREISYPYVYECSAKDCSNSIKDGSSYFFDEDESVAWRDEFYCSKECSKKQMLTFPKATLYTAQREKCCAKYCSKYLDFMGLHWKVPAVSLLACSEECATAQYNLIWGNDDGGREQTARREIDHDYWEEKGRKKKYGH